MKVWKPSTCDDVFTDDDRIQFGILNESAIQPDSTIVKSIVKPGKTITIRGLAGGKVKGTIIGFNNFLQKGRIIYFEVDNEPGFYGAIDSITIGQDILKIE